MMDGSDSKMTSKVAPLPVRCEQTLHISGTIEPIGFIETSNLWLVQGLLIARLLNVMGRVEVGA